MKALKNIGSFKLYNKKPNTIAKGGHVYINPIVFDVPHPFKQRMIRVYLPSTYDFDNPNHRFKVIYMCDGQNCFDEFTSGYGEWNVDECLENRVKQNLEVPIVVGFDCPHDEESRIREMTPFKDGIIYFKNRHGECYGDLYCDFIVNTIKPMIDSMFFTLPDVDNTAIGGSSMGGLMSFYMGMKRPDVFGFSLCFSPAFLCYRYDYLKQNIHKFDLSPNQHGRFYLYVGGMEFEAKFVRNTFFIYNHLKKIGYDKNQAKLVYDSSQIHHEKAWSKYLPDAFSYWLDKEK